MDQKIMEQAEAARIAGNREYFLRLVKHAEQLRQDEIQAEHARRVNEALKAWPVGSVILGSTVTKHENGCGTESGWINVYLSNGKHYTPAEIGTKLRERKDSARVSDAYNKIRFVSSGRVKLPGEYEEAIDDLITYMGLDRLTKISDCDCWDYPEAYTYARDEAVKDGYTDEEAEEKGREASDDARDQDIKEYKGKLLASISHVLHYADLVLTEGKGSRYFIEPGASWTVSADKMAEVITGYGMFEYKSGRDLKDSGPYGTYCEAVIQHLHWLKHGPEIYGDRGYGIN